MARAAATAIVRAAPALLASLLLLAAGPPARAQQPPVAPAAAAPPVQARAKGRPPAAPAGPPTIVRPHGPQYGYPDPDDPDRFVWVFLGGVEVEQPERRLVADTLVVVLRAAGAPPSAPAEPAAGLTL